MYLPRKLSINQLVQSQMNHLLIGFGYCKLLPPIYSISRSVWNNFIQYQQKKLSSHIILPRDAWNQITPIVYLRLTTPAVPNSGCTLTCTFEEQTNATSLLHPTQNTPVTLQTPHSVIIVVKPCKGLSRCSGSVVGKQV